MLTNGIMWTISGCENLRHTGIYFRPFANSVRDTKYDNNVGLSIKSLKEGQNRGFDPSLRKLSIESLPAHHVLAWSLFLKVGCKHYKHMSPRKLTYIT
jgi:hypothetical protein